MESMVKFAKATAAVVISAFWGLHVMIQLLVYAVLFDILTGLVAAWQAKSLNSAVSRRGIGKKVMVIICVCGAEIAGRHLGIQVPSPWGGTPLTIGAAVATYYCIHEALSITENIAKAGVPLPKWITSSLEKLKD